MLVKDAASFKKGAGKGFGVLVMTPISNPRSIRSDAYPGGLDLGSRGSHEIPDFVAPKIYCRYG